MPAYRFQIPFERTFVFDDSPSDLWRDKAAESLQAFWSTVDSEGRLHELVRRRKGPRPRMLLPEDSLELLAEWKGPVPVPGNEPVDIRDPAGPELEPEIARLESVGGIGFPRRSLFSGST